MEKAVARWLACLRKCGEVDQHNMRPAGHTYICGRLREGDPVSDMRPTSWAEIGIAEYFRLRFVKKFSNPAISKESVTRRLISSVKP